LSHSHETSSILWEHVTIYLFKYRLTGKLLGALIELRYASIDKNLLIEMNDSGFTFDEIADYQDRMDIQSAMIELPM